MSFFEIPLVGQTGRGTFQALLEAGRVSGVPSNDGWRLLRENSQIRSAANHHSVRLSLALKCRHSAASILDRSQRQGILCYVRSKGWDEKSKE